MVEFAAEFSRNDQGWVLFPDDAKLRKVIFGQLVPPEEIMGHPAKANLYMLRALVEYVSMPGETVMDIMAGTGSIMVAAAMQRSVICLDVEEGYYQLMMANLPLFTALPDAGSIFIFHGDCRRLLPKPCHHIIFSPPYADSLKQEASEIVAAKVTAGIEGYWQSQDNLGRLNRFHFRHQMERVYSLCHASIHPGGTMTVIMKDLIQGHKRLSLHDWTVQHATKMGFHHIETIKKYARGTGWRDIARSKGAMTVDDEDMIIFRRPLDV